MTHNAIKYNENFRQKKKDNEGGDGQLYLVLPMVSR